MIKKIIAGALCGLTIALCAGCGCGNTVETLPPKTYDIEPGIDLSEYAAFVTDDEWVNTETGDTFCFYDSGMYEGKIGDTDYKGTFELKVLDDKKGIVAILATPEGETEQVQYELNFETSSEAVLTIGDDVSVKLVAKWTTEQKDKAE